MGSSPRPASSACGVLDRARSRLGCGGNVAANSRINVAFIGVGSQGLAGDVRFPRAARRPGRGRGRPRPLRGQLPPVGQRASSATGPANSSGVETGWDWLSPNAPMLALTPSFSAPAGVAAREPAQRIVDGFNGRNTRSGASPWLRRLRGLPRDVRPAPGHRRRRGGHDRRAARARRHPRR